MAGRLGMVILLVRLKPGFRLDSAWPKPETLVTRLQPDPVRQRRTCCLVTASSRFSNTFATIVHAAGRVAHAGDALGVNRRLLIVNARSHRARRAVPIPHP